MAEASSNPRVSAQYLDAYVGRNVILVGKVTQLRGDTAIIDSDGPVTAVLDRVLTSRDLGPDVDFKLASAVVEATQNFKPLFVYEGN
ncbi:hypothetical protein VdG1_05008 [Verticillium dahliae VDG1]|nr:hypothetical protein VdG1_05008 [Verticillium dahliae VDG1]